MVGKRKPIKPRPKKKVVKMLIEREVWVKPGGMGRWVCEFDDVVVARGSQQDMELLGRLLGRLSGHDVGTELFIQKRGGEIVDRSTYPSSADPARSKG